MQQTDKDLDEQMRSNLQLVGMFERTGSLPQLRARAVEA
jgi:hypothetical protein